MYYERGIGVFNDNGEFIKFVTYAKAKTELKNFLDLAAPETEWKWLDIAEIARRAKIEETPANLRAVGRMVRAVNQKRVSRRNGRNYLFCPPIIVVKRLGV